MYEVFEQLLQEFGVTTYQVAKATGISQSTLSSWKTRRNLLSGEKAKKIADYFGVTVDYLMTGIKDATPAKAKITRKDERDIAKDMENIIRKLRNNENGPASYDGEPIPEKDIDLLAGQIELMLNRLKPINKEKYNPDKYKK